MLSTDNEVCLVWLEDALQQLRPEGQTKVVGYLEAVLEEVVFEMKMAPSVVTSAGTEDPLEAMGRGCLFWLVVSVLLSVTLTVVVKLFLFVGSG